MKKIFCRGLNYHGQLGLGNKIQYTSDTFVELPFLNSIKTLKTNLAHTLVVDEDNKTIYYWGFNWDIRSFFRTTSAFQRFPTMMTALKSVWPPLKTFPTSPSILNKFSEEIVDVQLGGAHCFFLDAKGVCHALGDNTSGQLGERELDVYYNFIKIFPQQKDTKFVKIKAGFQHSLFLTDDGSVYGCGKSDKYQLGDDYLLKYKHKPTIRDEGVQIQKIEFNNIDGKIIDIATGKYHSLILTDSGKVYAIGVNRFGQLGVSNTILAMSGTPKLIEFGSDVKVTKILTGDNHNIMLGEDGSLYANGDNSSGQIDGELDKSLYFLCTPKKVPIPSNSKIKKIYAESNRTAALLENGEMWYWGGFAYEPKRSTRNFARYDGFNLYNSELGVPKNAKILDVGLGYLHDILIINS